MKKITFTKEIIKKNKNYLIVFGIVIVLFNFMLLINSAWPYGTNSLAISDSYAQIATYFEHIFRWLSGETSLFYTTKLGGGIEMISTIEYMLLNPFFLIILPFGPNNITTSINFSMLLMLLFNAFVMLWFISKRYNKLSDALKCIISLMFAFSSYVILNSAFITWFIYPGLTLLLFDAFLELVHNKKIWRFVLFLFWFVITCFSVGVSTNLILVPLFCGYIFFMCEKETRKEDFVRLFVAYVMGVILSVAFLLPALIALFQTQRVDSFFAQLLNYDTNKTYYLNLIPFLMTGAITIFALMFFTQLKRKDNEFKFNLYGILVVSLPILFFAILKTLCGGQFNAFPARFYFITETFLFMLALKYLDKKSEVTTEDVVSQKKFKLIQSALIGVVALFFICGELLLFTFLTGQAKNVSYLNSTFLVTIIFFVLLSGVFAFAVFTHKTKKLSCKWFNSTIAFLLSITFSLNALMFIGKLTSPPENKNYVVKMVNKHNLIGDVKFDDLEISSALTNTTIWTASTNSVFTSLVTDKALQSFSNLGYYSSNVFINGHYSDLISDSLVGNKFHLTTVEQNKPYYSLIDIVEHNETKFYLYENTLSTTGAIVIDPNYQFDKNLSYFENMERLRESFGVEGKLYSDIEYTSLPIDDFDKEHIEAVTKYTFTPEQDGIIYINHDSVQLNENKQFLKEYLKGENNFYFSTKELGVWQEIAFVKAGETYSFNHIKTVEYQDFYLSTPEFKFLNYETAKNLCIKMQENQAELKQTKNGYEINLNNKEGNLVVFSINLNGLNFMLDGKEIEANDAFGGFISTNVTKANQKLIINYSYPYLWIWILAMVICVGLAILIYHWHKKTQLKKLQKPIYAFWWILTCLILSIFYIFCIFLTIFKLIF